MCWDVGKRVAMDEVGRHFWALQKQRGHQEMHTYHPASDHSLLSEDPPGREVSMVAAVVTGGVKGGECGQRGDAG